MLASDIKTSKKRATSCQVTVSAHQLLLLAPLLWCQTTQASGNQMDLLFDMSLSQLLSIEVEVSNRNATPISETPASVTVYASEDIQSMGVRTLDELLNFVPGFNVARSDIEGRSYAPVVRGRRSNSVGRELLVLLDGIRLNDPVTGGVSSQERSINLANAKQVEIIRGPGSSMYGANAFSGIINIVTKDQGNFAHVEFGEFNAKHAVAMVSHDEKDWGVAATMAYYKDEGEHYPAFYNFFGTLNDTQDPERQTDFFIKAFLHKANLSIRHNERYSYDFISAGGQANDAQRHRVENTSARLSLESNILNSTINWFAEYSTNDADSLIGLFPSDPIPSQAGNPLYWSNDITIAMIGGNIRTVKQQRFGADGKYQISPTHLLNFGVLYRKESVGLNPFQSNIDIRALELTGMLLPSNITNAYERGFYIGGIRFDLLDPSSRQGRGIYAQSSWEVSSTTTLTTGVRYDHYQEFGDNISLRLGLVNKWDENTTFKLLYGDAFRAPSFLETKAGIASGGISNPNLKPEEVSTYEFIWIETHDNISSTLTFFHNSYNEMVVPVLVDDVVPGFTAFQPQNKGSESTNGVEWELSASISDHIRLRGGSSHLFNTVDNEPVGDTTFFIIADYNYKDLSVNMNAFYHDSILSRADDNIVIDNYIVTNLSMRYALSNALNITFKINNLFDTDYNTWSPQQGLEQGLPARGRQALIGLRYEI